MALDDFDSVEPEDVLANSEADLLGDLDDDLFDFPEVKMEQDEAVEADYPAEVVEAAAALQDELDSGSSDDDLFGFNNADLGEDLDLEDLLGDDSFLDEVSELEPAKEPEIVDELDEIEPAAEEDEGMSFDQLIPEVAPQPVKKAAAPKPEVAAEPEAAPMTIDEALEAEVAREAATGPFAALVTLATKTPARSVWAAVAAVLAFNLVLLVLGMSALSSVSSSVEGVSSSLGDVVREMQNSKVLQAREIEQATLAAARQEPEAPANTSTVHPRVEVEPFARGELKAARAEIDRGEFSKARRRLFRLLATIDDPLAEDESFAEEQSNLLIAESFVAESNALQGVQR